MHDITPAHLKSLRKLYSIMLELGYDFSDHYLKPHRRAVFQGLTHLAQRSGFRLGYQYRFHIAGPFCPELFDDGTLIAKNMELFAHGAEPFVLSESALAKAALAKDLAGPKPLDLDWIDTLVTADLLRSSSPRLEKAQVFDKLKSMKPHLDDRQRFELAWERLEGAGRARTES